MSGLLGVFHLDQQPVDGTVAPRMLARMSGRGADLREVWHRDNALLGVSRYAWEMEAGLSGAVLVLEEDDQILVADASLYYADDLRQRLRARGQRPRGATPSHLILAAYRAWGADCAAQLEGDFAFILWDRRQQVVLCARDLAARRTLFYAEAGHRLIVASSLAAVVAHPDCPPELNVAAVGSTVARLFAGFDESCYSGVRAMPARHTLVRRADGPTRLTAYWQPPVFREGGGGSFEEGAMQLRSLLTRAVAERLAPSGRTSVWMSGGWDSTAIFAAGQAHLERSGDGSRLTPVSVSYPAGDPGREDELIQAVLARWDSSAHWLDIDRIPLFDRPAERAAMRDEPIAHAFEHWNRALARGSVGTGSHIVLDGDGGDQFFSVTQVFLGDLLRRGRWMELAREWQAEGAPPLRALFPVAVVPVLPSPLRRAGELLRGGRPLFGYLEPRVPEWIEPRFLRAHGLVEKDRALRPRRGRSGAAALEHRWYFEHAYFPRMAGVHFGFTLEEGVETRSAFWDRRVIEFAASRPRNERFTGRETKRLLRASMRGLLPDHVLAPRRTRTGITGPYFERELRREGADLFSHAFDSPLLADLGIVDPGVLRRNADAFVRGESHGDVATGLFFALHTELWLRARAGDDRRLGGNSQRPTFALAR